jgi:hypothetical protein
LAKCGGTTGLALGPVGQTARQEGASAYPPIGTSGWQVPTGQYEWGRVFYRPVLGSFAKLQLIASSFCHALWLQ